MSAGAAKGRGRREPEHPDVRLSKAFTKVLRHEAVKAGLPVRDDGYIRLDHVLLQPNIARLKPEIDDVKRIVEENNKKRLSLRHLDDVDDLEIENVVSDLAKEELSAERLYIRANQGHSILEALDDAKMLKVLEEDLPDELFHATFPKSWPIIVREGLNRMSRRHIHMVDKEDSPVGRKAARILVVVSTKRARELGAVFYKSANGVFLCPGLEDSGILPPECIVRVVDRKTNRVLHP